MRSILSIGLLAGLSIAACTDDASVNARRVAHDSAGGSGGEDGSGGSAGSIDLDQDGDKHIGNADCDPDDGTIFRGAPEVCDDGLDNDCDGKIDEGCDCDPCGHGGAGGSDDNGGSGGSAEPSDDPDPLSGESHILSITVTTPNNLPAFNFSFGYCSDKSAARCNDWNEDVARVLWGDDLTWDIIVESTGGLRANGEIFTSASNVANHDDNNAENDRIVGTTDRWLCTLVRDVPTLMLPVRATLDGHPIPQRLIRGIPFQNGCSMAIEIDEVLETLVDK